MAHTSEARPTVNAGEVSLFTPLLAIGFGLLSFLSPYWLPLLPAYLGMIAGSAGTARDSASRWGLLWNGLAFVAGLSVGFAIWAQRECAEVVAPPAASAPHAGWWRSDRAVRTADARDFASRLARADLSARRAAACCDAWRNGRRVYLGSDVQHRLDTVHRTVLRSLLTLAAQEQTVAAGTLLLLFYGLGPGIPFVAAGLAADRALRWSQGLRSHLGLIERVGGVLLAAMGILLVTGELTLINVWAIRTSGLGLALQAAPLCDALGELTATSSPSGGGGARVR